MKIYELLATPDKWTKEAFGRDKNGNALIPLNLNNAVCYCLEGALFKAYPEYKQRCEVRDKIEQLLNGSIPIWNDASERTHQEVLDLVTKLNI